MYERSALWIACHLLWTSQAKIRISNKPKYYAVGEWPVVASIG